MIRRFGIPESIESISLLIVVILASIVQMITNHIGLLFLAWSIAGGALTLLVRLEGGETASKPGRILQIQQHASTILLFGFLVFLLQCSESWVLGSNSAGSLIDSQKAFRIMASAGIQHARRWWPLVITVWLTLIITLRLGIVLFPFSLRRTSRRLGGGVLFVFLGIFLPTSIGAFGMLYSHMVTEVGSMISITLGIIGAVAVFSGGLWLQTEWRLGSMAGHVAQIFVGLGLLALARGDYEILRFHIFHMMVVIMFFALFEIESVRTLKSSDIASWDSAYISNPHMRRWHVGIICAVIPWPGTPAGRIWVSILANDFLTGGGAGILASAGIILLFSGMIRSFIRVNMRTHERQSVFM